MLLAIVETTTTTNDTNRHLTKLYHHSLHLPSDDGGSPSLHQSSTPQKPPGDSLSRFPPWDQPDYTYSHLRLSNPFGPLCRMTTTALQDDYNRDKYEACVLQQDQLQIFDNLMTLVRRVVRAIERDLEKWKTNKTTTKTTTNTSNRANTTFAPCVSYTSNDYSNNQCLCKRNVS